MTREIMCSIGFLVFIGLAFFGNLTESKPLDYEDVAGLLPPEPQDVNETMAAIVQDPVVKDAVHLAASNGSLNGLVVKRKTFIMPATDPNTVLSKREQLFVVPAEHLENVRKNITESKELEANESTTVENLSSVENNLDLGPAQNYAEPENGESAQPVELSNAEVEFAEEPQADSAEDDVRPAVKSMEHLFVPRIPPRKRQPKTILVPVVAVLDPEHLRSGRMEASILAILPDKPEDEMLGRQIDFFDGNREKIRKKAQEHIDRMSLAVDPETWNLVRTPAEAGDKHLEYPRDVNDMDVAEDIVFRPLFRYRQEAQRRSRIRENSYRPSYRRPYDPYDSYPKRNDDYRPWYSQDYHY